MNQPLSDMTSKTPRSGSLARIAFVLLGICLAALAAFLIGYMLQWIFF